MLFRNLNLGLDVNSGTRWEISPDGKRFVMIKMPASWGAAADVPRQKIIIVTNWFEELKQRVPVP